MCKENDFTLECGKSRACPQRAAMIHVHANLGNTFMVCLLQGCACLWSPSTLGSAALVENSPCNAASDQQTALQTQQWRSVNPPITRPKLIAPGSPSLCLADKKFARLVGVLVCTTTTKSLPFRKIWKEYTFTVIIARRKQAAIKASSL
jgi:hypothetical protein